MKVLGLMSGTSFDAIEVAAADLRLEGKDLLLRPLGARTTDLEPELRDRISAALPPAATSMEAVCQLDTRLGQAFAAAALGAAEELCGGRADLVVSHGQTLYHWVEDGRARGTLQLGQAAWISEATGSVVVSDLRNRDIAAGGHGAPLVSCFDALLFGGVEPTAALNLGGIANLTILDPEQKPLAFDTGPANALVDAAVARLTGGRETCDTGGHRAARGSVLPELLEALLDDPYFALPPPKSTGKEHFNPEYVRARIEKLGRETPEEDDLIATLTAFTARSVADALKSSAGGDEIRRVVASGGGTSNPTMIRMLREAAPGVAFRTVEEWGIPSSAKEAYAFAVLGFLTVNGLPGTVPSCTGASRATLLGTITPGAAPLALPTPAATEPERILVKG